MIISTTTGTTPSPPRRAGVPTTAAAAPESHQWLGQLPTGARLRRFGVRVCVLYTVLTVTSSGWALTAGQEIDTHLHLLTRLVFVLIGLGAVELVDVLRRRGAARGWLLAIIGYLVAIAAIMAGLWVFVVAGGELHPDAYRDAFWNFTAVGALVVVGLAVRDLIRVRRRRGSGRSPTPVSGAGDEGRPS